MEQLRQAKGRIAMLEEQLHQAKGRIAMPAEQRRALPQTGTGGTGTEKPACWVSPETGKPEYIFDIALTSTGLIVRDNALPHRLEAQSQLPLQTMVFGEALALERFLVGSRPLFEWGTKQIPDCRFFVRVFDLTQAHEKDVYKRHLRTVGQHFYYYEAPNAQF